MRHRSERHRRRGGGGARVRLPRLPRLGGIAALFLAASILASLPDTALAKRKPKKPKTGSAAETCANPASDGTCPAQDLWPTGDGLLASSIRALLHSPAGLGPRNPLAALVVNSDFFLEYCADTKLAHATVTKLNAVLEVAGVPPKNRFTEDEMVLYIFAAFWTLVGYYALVGKRHGRNRRKLAEELRAAQLQVHELEERLLLAQRQDIASPSTGPKRREGQVRIFMDGAFDMMHYGHMNAFRLGRSLGTKLVVGVNSDESITKCKGAPLMNDQERLTMVSGCKFVDEVVPGCPYVMNAEYVKYVIEKLDIDYVVHGDDPCIVDGKDVYAAAKEAGKYQSIPRTEGVSTTDIVGRMLTLTKDHHVSRAAGGGSGGGDKGDNMNASSASLTGDTAPSSGGGGGGGSDDQSVTSMITAATAGEHSHYGRPLCETSKFLTTSRMLRQFSAGMEPPEPGMKVIYMDGAWDMFHCGHVTVLKEAKKRGDYLIVGVHGDSVVNRVRGGNLPIMNLHERVLSVMGCRYVDDVLIDAPYHVTPDMVASLKIAEVVRGSRSDEVNHAHDLERSEHDDGGAGGGTLNGEGNGGGDAREDRWFDRYSCPRSMGIFTVLPSPTDFDLGSIVSRIRRNQDAFQAKIARKKKAEGEYYDVRYGRNSTAEMDNRGEKTDSREEENGQ